MSINPLTTFLTNIANCFRNIKGSTEKINAQDFENEIENVSLKKLFDTTKSTRYIFSQSYGISGTTSNLSNFLNYNDTENVENISYMFDGNYYLRKLPEMNLGKVKNTVAAFRGCAALEEIPEYNTISVTNFRYTFSGCSALKTVHGLDMSSTTDASNMFGACNKLEDVKLYNINCDLVLGVSGSIGDNLTKESLIKIFEELINTDTLHTLTIGSVNLAKLEGVYVDIEEFIETDKGRKAKFVIAPEGTSEDVLDKYYFPILEYPLLFQKWNVI